MPANLPDSNLRMPAGCCLTPGLIGLALFGLVAGAAAQTAPYPGGPPSPSASIRKSTKAAQAKGARRSKGSKAATDTSTSNPLGALRLSSDNGPLDIKSDSLNLDYKANNVLFSGHVRATQGATTLTSDVLKVNYTDNFKDIKEAVAEGNVHIAQGGRWATSKRAVLDQVKHTVEMTGDPVVHDGPDQVAGNRILIYLDSQKSVVEGAHAVIFPHQSENRDNGS